MKRYLIILPALLLNLLTLVAQVSFNASAPAGVVKGEQFRLTYTLKNGQGSNPKFPNEIKGFDILYGPTLSQSHSTQIINGKTTTESSESYTFVLMGNQEGTFTIPSASITADGKTLTSNTLTVNVLPQDKTTQNNQQRQGGQNSGSTSTAQNINANDAFIRPIVTKTKVFEQEAFVITFRFYTTLNVKDIGKIEFPEFEGFMVEEQDLPVNRQLSLEHYNGRNYYAVDLRKTLLFPQRFGKITIPPGKIEMVFSVPSGRKIQSFFGPQEVMTDVKRTMQTNPVIIDVAPLPAGKPDNFSNAVGSFTMKSEISDTEITANEAITITLTIAGTGNMKLIKNPEIELPSDFEAYDPKITNNFRIVENGLTGIKKLEYLFIPRHQGQYTIPPIEFSYFDPKTNVYRTLTSPEYNLKVAKDPNAGNNAAVSYTNQNEVQAIQDIRFLKTKDIKYTDIDNFIMGSVAFYLWYLIPSVLFFTSFILYRKQIKQNANIALMRTKKANKVATKRLKLADSYLKAHNREKFYEEVLRALWGYLSDKLLIPVADLNRDNIEHELLRFGASEQLVGQFISILDKCEFARYAPSASDTEMDTVYNETVNTISKMESVVKKRK